MERTAFKRVILYARHSHRAYQDVHETLQRLLDYLHTQAVEVYFAQDTEASFGQLAPVLEPSAMSAEHDLIVVVGGDGSLLSAARMAIQVNLPVIGINRGHLGFLTDVSPQDVETQLGAILAGSCKEEHRFLLHMRIHNEHTTFFQAEALNDVVLSRGNETRLIEFTVQIDDQFVSHYRSDGLILSTPTGSTAYALSAGGPILHPQLNAMVMVPMFSHSLSSRPLVFDGHSRFNMHISANNEQDLQVSCDGHSSYCVQPGQQVTIEKNIRQLCLLHPLDYHYYDTLRIKLGWGSAL